MLRKKLGCLLATALMVTTTVPVAAFASTPLQATDALSALTTYESSDGDYTFEKISHPDQGTKTADGIVDYLGNGEVAVPDGSDTNEGDRGQSYSWSAVSYGDYLYVGTCYSAMGNTLTLMQSTLGDKFDKETMEAALKAMFNGTFYYGHEDGVDSGGILVKMNTKTGELTLLMSKSMNGISALFRNSIAYNGRLYFCGSVNVNGRGGLPSVYEIDPETDDYKVVYEGLSNYKDYAAAYKAGISTGIRGMCVYDGKLVISNVYMDSTTGKSGATILESSDPSSGFTQIAESEDLFNYPAYRYKDSIYGGSIWDMTEYNGHLYVSICTGTPENAPDDNSMQSFAIVRGDKNDDGAYTWTPVIGDQENDGARYTFGIDPERTRSGAANLMVYNGYLYIGEYNDEEIALERILFNKSGDDADGSLGGIDCSFVDANLEQSVNLYRMDENENIELVVGDVTEMFPNGSLSGLGSGWGSNENQYVWRMQVYDGKLYVGTFDTSSLLEPIGQFSNGDIINMTPEEWESELGYLKELIELVLKDKGGPTPIATMGDDDAAAASEDEQMASDLEELYSELEVAENYLSDGCAVATASEDEGSDSSENIDDKIQYHQSFAEYYEGLLNYFEQLQQKYSLPQDIVTRVQKLLSKDNLNRVNSVIKCLRYMSSATRGFDLYVTDDGVNFTTVTKNGFDDPYNHGLRVFAATGQGLCIGTANPFNGTQLWIQRGYAVTYDANGGEGSVEDSNRYDAGETATVLANGFIREGYTFAGWNTAADGSGTTCAPGDQIEMSDAVTLYAQWTEDEKPVEKNLSVTYDANGGEGSVEDSAKYAAGEKATVLANGFIREGYTFAGWNTAADGSGASCQPGEQVEVDADVTLYAQWTKSDDGKKDDGKSDGGQSDDGKSGGSGSNSGSKTSGDASSNASQSGKKASSSTPKTGDVSSPAIVAVIAVAGAACALAAYKARGLREH